MQKTQLRRAARCRSRDRHTGLGGTGAAGVPSSPAWWSVQLCALLHELDCFVTFHSTFLTAHPDIPLLNKLFSLAALPWSTGEWTPHQGIMLMLRVRMAYLGTRTLVQPGRRQKQLWPHLRISQGLGEKEIPALHVSSCKGTTWTNFPYSTIKGKVATVPTKQFTP